MPLRSVKMKRFILGFQRRVWCPKCTPLSRSWRIVTTAMPTSSLSLGCPCPVGRPARLASAAHRTGRSRTVRCAPAKRCRSAGARIRPADRSSPQSTAASLVLRHAAGSVRRRLRTAVVGSAHGRRRRAGPPAAGPPDARLRHHDLRRDDSSGHEHRRHQPRPGLPRHRRPLRRPGRRCRGDPLRPQPVPAGSRRAGAAVALAGGTRRTVVLRAPDFLVDEQELRAAFTSRTKVVVVNTPHNPTGKVFTPEELALVGRLAAEHGAVVLSDEVYEHLLFSDGPTGGRHVPVATLPGMAERTLTISSAGKTFSVTGWKVGWVHGPPGLIDAVRAVKQFVTFVASGPFQPAVAVGLGLPDEVYAGLASALQERRDLLCEGLHAAGLTPLVPAGTYFVIVDGAELGYDDGLELCRALPSLAGVVAVPVRVFQDDPEAGRSLIRFAFCKQPAVLEEAARRLSRLRG